MDKDESKEEVAGKAKPIPIREAVGEPGPRRAGNSGTKGSETQGNVPTPPAQAPRSEHERRDGPRGKRTSDGRGHRPDRKRAPSGGEERRRPPLQPTPLEDFPARSFEHDGCEWIVRLCGQASTGSARDPGAPLMHLAFYRATAPDTACGDLLETGRSLEGLSELRLSELLSSVRLAPSANDSSDFRQAIVGVVARATPYSGNNLESTRCDQMLSNLTELTQHARVQMKQLGVLALCTLRI